MAQEDGQEKTEAPTAKRREDGRKEGQVAVSREISSATLLGAFSLYFFLAGQTSLASLESVLHYSFSNLIMEDLTVESLGGLFQTLLGGIFGPIFGIFGMVFIVALAISYLQVGATVTGLKFQASRLSPLGGLKRIFSTQGLMELFKSLFKTGVIGLITYFSLADEVLPILGLTSLSVDGILEFNFSLLGGLYGRVAIALLALAILDYLYQRWQLEQRLKMSKQELKDELKQTEGDPQLRARVRQIQREVSRARMMENVPKSDVIVTNPTHYAVALMYDREAMAAPRLLAKGADFLAARIREIAKENEIPIVENPAVAREIYAQVEVGEEIPEEFFRSVAEILAYVYRLKGHEVEPTG